MPRKREYNEKSGLIALWALGIFFLTMTLAAFLWGKSSDGYFCLATACLLLPPLRSLFQRKTGLRLSGGLTVTLCVALFVIGGVMEKPKLHPHNSAAPSSVIQQR